MRIKPSSLIHYIVLAISLLSFGWVLAAGNNEDYALLWMLPFSFFLCSLFFQKVYRLVPSHLGVTVLLMLEFFRMTVLPVFFVNGNYLSTYSNIADSMGNGAILLMVYEVFVVFATIRLSMLSRRLQKKVLSHEEAFFYSTRTMTGILVALSLAFILTIVIAPESLLMYKNLLSFNDVNFTSLEGESYVVVAKYGTTFIKKLAMVLHVYLMKILRFLIPLQIIVKIYQKDTKKKRFYACVLVSVLSSLIIDGTIARSLIYCLVFLYVSTYIYHKEGKLYKYLIMAASLVIVYFLFRRMLTNSQYNYWEYFSKAFNAYFSGAPNTAGVMRLPFPAGDLLQYFLCDYFQSVPFGNTIFGVSGVSMQNYFNTFNGTYGQIPTTIGVGYLYFGPVFAPLYSALFAYLTYRFGYMANRSSDVLRKGLYSYAALSCAMGIVMYYIQIALTSLGTMVVPILIVSVLARRRRKKRGKRIEVRT